jgi:hypothetical protein
LYQLILTLLQVPYTIDSSLAGNSLVRGIIQEAILRFSTYTSVRLVERTTEADFVTFVRNDGFCNSLIGRAGGQQIINLDGTGLCPPAITVHEIAHALGLFHTQSRLDRDTYITVNLENIDPDYVSNYLKYSDSCAMADCGQDILAYDYGSVMHYGQHDFQADGTSGNTFDVVADKFAEYEALYGSTVIGQRKGFSGLDVDVIQFLYDACIDSPPLGNHVWHRSFVDGCGEIVLWLWWRDLQRVSRCP